MGAIRLAECLINALDCRDIAHVDMAREIGRLREIAKLCRRLNAPYAPQRHGTPRENADGTAVAAS